MKEFLVLILNTIMFGHNVARLEAQKRKIDEKCNTEATHCVQA